MARREKLVNHNSNKVERRANLSAQVFPGETEDEGFQRHGDVKNNSLHQHNGKADLGEGLRHSDDRLGKYLGMLARPYQACSGIL